MNQSNASRRRVLVLDDDENFVASVLDALRSGGFEAQGFSLIDKAVGACKKKGYDLILIDMRLGTVNAARVLPKLVTYGRSAKVAVFSQADIGPDEIMRCLQLGALAAIPKAARVKDLLKLAQMLVEVGTKEEARERIIKLDWADALGADVSEKGPALERVMINLFHSMIDFTVIGQNILTNAGEIDVLVKNTSQDSFWKRVNSEQVVVECKNHKRSSELTRLNQLKNLVETRGDLCRAGMLVSMSPTTRGLKQRREEILKADKVRLLVLLREDVEELVHLSAQSRAERLREICESQ
jgi:CheY-like chemotaxis protein